jgi:hypothetical protein
MIHRAPESVPALFARPPDPTRNDAAPLAGGAGVKGTETQAKDSDSDSVVIPPPKRSGSFLSAALQCRRLGWSVLPIRHGARPDMWKKPTVRWKKFQTTLPDETTVKGWFSSQALHGLAVILGQVSGGLYARDFDVEGSYEDWARRHPNLASRLPTVRTGRGFHVYFRSASAMRTRKLADGELRGDGGYNLLAPSIHPSGAVYAWVVHVPDEGVPIVDPVSSGLAPAGSSALNPGLSLGSGSGPWVSERKGEGVPTLSAVRSPSVSSSSSSEAVVGVNKGCSKERNHPSSTDIVDPVNPVDPVDPIDPVNPVDPVKLTPEDVLNLAIVNGIGQHDTKTLTLARGLKFNCGMTQEEARPYFDRWWAASRAHCRDADPDAAWFKFLRAWDTSGVPLNGLGVAARVLGALHAVPLLPEAARYGPTLARFASALAEMARLQPDEPFAVSAHMVARSFGVNPGTAQWWFTGLDRDGVIRCVDRGKAGANGTGRARRIVFLGFNKERR